MYLPAITCVFLVYLAKSNSINTEGKYYRKVNAAVHLVDILEEFRNISPIECVLQCRTYDNCGNVAIQSGKCLLLNSTETRSGDMVVAERLDEMDPDPQKGKRYI